MGSGASPGGKRKTINNGYIIVDLALLTTAFRWAILGKLQNPRRELRRGILCCIATGQELLQPRFLYLVLYIFLVGAEQLCMTRFRICLVLVTIRKSSRHVCHF
jgi:hypothetical protein